MAQVSGAAKQSALEGQASTTPRPERSLGSGCGRAGWLRGLYGMLTLLPALHARGH